VTYNLEKDTPFELSLEMAKIDEVDLAFSITNTITGKVVLNLSPRMPGAVRTIETSAVLEAGEYEFAMEAKVRSMMASDRLWDRAGMGMYDVSLDFEEESYWVTLYDKVPVMYSDIDKYLDPNSPDYLNLELRSGSIFHDGKLYLAEDFRPLGADPEPEDLIEDPMVFDGVTLVFEDGTLLVGDEIYSCFATESCAVAGPAACAPTSVPEPTILSLVVALSLFAATMRLGRGSPR
jgi:hypothetical protein